MAARRDLEILSRRDVVRRVRDYLRDYEEINTLIDGEESPEIAISNVLDIILDEVNSEPPPVGLLLAQNIPLNILVDGVCSRLLESVAALQARNNIAFSAGGVSVQFDQYQTYMSLSQTLRARFEQALRRWKVAMNAQQAVDATAGVVSDWSLVSRLGSAYLGNAGALNALRR